MAKVAFLNGFISFWYGDKADENDEMKYPLTGLNYSATNAAINVTDLSDDEAAQFVGHPRDERSFSAEFWVDTDKARPQMKKTYWVRIETDAVSVLSQCVLTASNIDFIYNGAVKMAVTGFFTRDYEKY